MSAFIKQLFRDDILKNMLSLIHLGGKEMYNIIMTDNNSSSTSERRQGWIYESVFQILVVLKCVEGISYTHICDGQLQNLNEMKNIIPLMKTKVEGGGNNIIDLAIKRNDTTIVFTVKYKNKYSETDVCKIDHTITEQHLLDNDFKITNSNNTCTVRVYNKILTPSRCYYHPLPNSKQH